MPITNGFEACELIRTLYNDFKIFRPDLHKKATANSKKDRSLAKINRRQSLLFKDDFLKEDQMFCPPLICASTGFLDETTHLRAQQAGFDLSFNCLNANQIQEDLLPLLAERQREIMVKNQAFFNSAKLFELEKIDFTFY